MPRKYYPCLSDESFMQQHAELTNEELAAQVGCTVKHVNRMRRALKISDLPSRRRWTEPERELLCAFFPTYTADLLACALRRNPYAIYRTASRERAKGNLAATATSNGIGKSQDRRKFWHEWHQYIRNRWPAWSQNGELQAALNLTWRPARRMICAECCLREECRGSDIVPCEIMTVADAIGKTT